MKKLSIPAIIALALIYPAGASAQSFQTGFFLENFTYSFQLNPASQPNQARGFFGLGIANVNIGANSNLGLDSFLFPVNVDGSRKLVTGFNENVSSETFLGGLDDMNKAKVGASVNVLSFGASGKKRPSFYTFELNVRADVAAEVTKDVFAFLKNGGTDSRTYDGSGTSMNGTAFVEIANGYSYRINRHISVGGRLKLLAGVADMGMMFNDLNARAGDDVSFDSNGSFNIHTPGMTFPSTADGYLDLEGETFNTGLKPAGYGAALDLGVELRFPKADKLVLSAAIQDLGGMVWLNGQKAHADIDSEMIEDDGFDESRIFKLDQSGVNEFHGMGPRINLGLKYQALKMLELGALATVRTGSYSFVDTRLGASFNPGRALSIAGSAGLNSYGFCFGAALSLRIPGFNLYLGTDSVITEFTPEYIPVHQLNTRINLGLVMAFGKSR